MTDRRIMPMRRPVPPRPDLPSGRFAGRSEFAQLVRDALACAAREGWREIILSDANFEDWPLGERAVAESLQAWSKAGRKFTMLAQRYDDVSAPSRAFRHWRRTWAHIVECRRCRVADPLELPSAIWSPAWVLHRLDLERSTAPAAASPSAACDRGKRSTNGCATARRAFPLPRWACSHPRLRTRCCFSGIRVFDNCNCQHYNCGQRWKELECFPSVNAVSLLC